VCWLLTRHFFQDMVSHTEPDHPDYRDLSAAKQKMKIVRKRVANARQAT